MNNLSYSKYKKYLECPKRYEYYYNKKIRSIILGSPLFFGSAIDESLNSLLLTKKKILSNEEQIIVKQNYLEVFQNKMNNFNFNGKDIDIKVYPYIKYSKSDIDIKLLENQEYVKSFLQFYYSNSKPSKKDTEEYNSLCHKSLLNKGKLILKTYKEEIIPKIEEVFSIQEFISIKNLEGDKLIGYIDFTASFIDEPEVKYVIDNKTSSKAYTDNDIKMSEQLSIYAEYKQLKNIAYIVMEKNIRVRDPQVRINILKGKITKNFTNITFDNIENTLLNIRDDYYPKDTSSGCNFFGSKCEYYDLCFKNKMTKQLINLKQGEKNDK